MTIELGELDIISRIGESCKHIFYHRLCKISLENKLRLTRLAQTERREWHQIREDNKEAFSVVADFVKINVIINKQRFFLSYLKTLYNEEFKRLHTLDPEKSCDTRYLQERLLSTFKREIAIRFIQNTKVVVPYGDTILETDLAHIKNDNDIRTVAQKLRDDILNMPATKISENYTHQNLIKGECEIPSSLQTFLSTLLCGTNAKRKMSQYKQRSVSSIAIDMIFSIKKGRVKRSKHLTLGLSNTTVGNPA